jgi:mRNA interferase RelE/StbE
MYTVTFKPSALKELSNINNKDAKKIFQKITELENEPRPVNCKKLVGSNENLYRIRVGVYRVIYMIDDGIKIVDIRGVGHRKDIYN